MKSFFAFLADGSVKKQLADKNLSDDLAKDSQERFNDSKLSLRTGRKPKYIYENVYEALREAADSVLFLKGYKSFSHEATISFLQHYKEISSKEIADFDRMRVKRNGMKYYGKSCSEKDVEEAINFAEPLMKKLLEIRRSLLNSR
ncbi:MAG: HEPN domain-containing protein [Candidatus Aenigmarchaeota archaeon]|nr:HEPN domain-containing protein [Candidatus Aenigmarchaeota archaeon]MDI6722834.1 HEPN domain-containing protein [Candidatus Aenigmarchaeota archaeon]